MWPVIFEVPGTSIRLYSFGLMVALGFLAANAWVLRRAEREGLERDKVSGVLVSALLVGIVGARLLYVAINWDEFAGSPLGFFRIWQGGLVWYGGLLAAFPFGVWAILRKRLPLWRTADLVVTGLMLGLAIGRIGCLLAGDDYGEVTDVPWAIVFPDHPRSLLPQELVGKPLHPTQIYMSLNGLFLFGIGNLVRSRRRFDGQTTFTLTLIYAFTRSFIELYRGDVERGIAFGLSTSQWISIPVALVSVAMLVVLARRNRLHSSSVDAPRGTTARPSAVRGAGPKGS
jgi:phosphatidylglycerol:prolipoprotein diacylglycerol transferase